MIPDHWIGVTPESIQAKICCSKGDCQSQTPPKSLGSSLAEFCSLLVPSLFLFIDGEFFNPLLKGLKVLKFWIWNTKEGSPSKSAQFQRKTFRKNQDHQVLIPKTWSHLMKVKDLFNTLTLVFKHKAALISLYSWGAVLFLLTCKCIFRTMVEKKNIGIQGK